MRIRTAKQRAQRIDLNYFKRSHGLRRVRTVLSILLPSAAILWIGAVAAAGRHTPYSAGPLSRAHGFAEARCAVCHRTVAAGRAAPAASDHAEFADRSFRRHATDGACLTCHDAPVHAANQTTVPSCSTCHRDHRGRVDLSKTEDRVCVECHGDLQTAHGDSNVATSVRTFPSGHPEFAAVRGRDPGRISFNHAVHLKDAVRGPDGPEQLPCGRCHTPEVLRTAANPKKPASTGLMAPISYRQHCARCHPLFFDERIAQETPHDTPEKARAFVEESLVRYIRQNPDDMMRSDDDVRRVPLNFPRPVEPPARTPQEWVARRAAFDERILWNKTCESCHAARGSTKTLDVLLPNQSVCATCHAPSRGAEHRCFECHRYHDWTKAHPVRSTYTLTDFK